MATLQQFSDKFLERLQAPDFGLSSYQKSPVGILSPAAKEIRAKALQPILSAPRFLRQIDCLGQRYQEIVQGQRTVRQHKQRVRPAIAELRNLRKTLEGVNKNV